MAVWWELTEWKRQGWVRVSRSVKKQGALDQQATTPAGLSTHVSAG